MFGRRYFTHSVLTLTVAFMFAAMHPVLAHAGSGNWTKLSPAKSPSPRTYSVMAYDPVSKKIVLFGGATLTSHFNDTWTFDGTTWSQVKTPVAPPARSATSMAFDKQSKKLVMFGGFSGQAFLHDTWLWDGATSTWTQVKMKSWPAGQSGAMLFTDPLSGRAMMFGGYNPERVLPYSATTWRWTGLAWNKLKIIPPAYPRAWGIAVLDPVRNNVVLAAGSTDILDTNTTWTWDGAKWMQQNPATPMPGLSGPGSAFDSDSQSVVAFGGWTDSAGNQTWSWTGTNWNLLNPARSPAAREGAGMAYDPNLHEIVMFGGDVNPVIGKLFGDTWKWTGK